MEHATVLEQALANTGRVVAGIGDDQWDAATPCTRWNVRELVTHTAGVMANFRNAARNEDVVGDPDDFDLGADASAMFTSLAAENVAAWRDRGELDSIVRLGDNRFPGQVALTINMLDAYVHGWDIARATDQEASLDPAICAALLEFSREAVPVAPREGDRFAEVVDVGEGAGPVDELLGHLGRRP